jgi:hypothetical protein
MRLVAHLTFLEDIHNVRMSFREVLRFMAGHASLGGVSALHGPEAILNRMTRFTFRSRRV